MQLTSEQIQILLVEKLAGTIEDADNQVVERLIAEEPAVRQQWMDMQQQLGQLGGMPRRANEEEAWRKLSSGMLPGRSTGRRRAGVAPLLMRAAAAVVVVVVGALFLLRSKPSNPLAGNFEWKGTPVIRLYIDNGNNVDIAGVQTIQLGDVYARASQKEMVLPAGVTAAPRWSTLAVPSTMGYKLSLADGTEVWLNAQTRIHFPSSFRGPRREVYIEGEAFFKVSKDQLHPFIVHARRTEVRVLGTSFNINTYETDREETALVDGAVVSRDTHGAEVTLRPGNRAVYSPEHGFSTQSFDSTELLSWMKGVYYFHDTPLKDLSKVLTRWYNAEIYFKNDDLRSKTFSGELDKAHTLQAFLDNLNLSEEMHASFSDGKVIFQ